MSLRIHGRRTLKSPPGKNIRPTSSRVRQSVFSILQDRVEGCRWLDLCSGAGTMGAEALSRGAAFVLGVDASRRACDIMRANWLQVNPGGDRFSVVHADVRTFLRRPRTQPGFEIVYFDPPYNSPIYDEVLSLAPDWVAADGRILVEHNRDRVLPDRAGALELMLHRRYGQGELSVYGPAATAVAGIDPRT